MRSLTTYNTAQPVHDPNNHTTETPRTIIAEQKQGVPKTGQKSSRPGSPVDELLRFSSGEGTSTYGTEGPCKGEVS